MKFRPLHDRVVVRRIEADQKTAGGIYEVNIGAKAAVYKVFNPNLQWPDVCPPGEIASSGVAAIKNDLLNVNSALFPTSSTCVSMNKPVSAHTVDALLAGSISAPADGKTWASRGV